ncbi:MAG: DUF4296 domain-containing protein [Flavobacteriales bacterium]|nr:DUF4296 domain-containing protein [Flavobacteriales bacterium]MCC6939738.1 DUF4296 domain-containing protein [Flavobacteriales bacterium]
MTRAWLIGLLILAGCAPKETLPEGVLDREHFTEVVLGATLIEARMNVERTTELGAAIPMDRYYDDLFKEQGIDRAQFEKSFNHYAEQPLVMKAIYDDVIDRLRIRKDDGLQRDTLRLAKDTTFATDPSSEMK